MNSTQIQLLVNNNNKRWFQILSNLERSSILLKNQLANLLNASPRTVTSDIKEIKSYFDQSATITVSNNGYALSIDDKVTYLEKKKETVRK